MNRGTRFILALIAGLAGIALFTVTADREFINLTPTEGQGSAIILESRHTYTQRITARRSSISRVGLFLRPAVRQVTKGSITITVQSEGTESRQEIPTDFIDSEGPTQVHFSPPVPTSGGAVAVITIEIPKNLSGQIRAQIRQLDETFDPTYAEFKIDNTTQSAPLAYQMYYIEHPPLALQIGGLLLVTALLLLIGQGLNRPLPFSILTLALPLLYSLPAFPDFPLSLIILQMISFALMIKWLKRFSLPPPATLLGTILFTFTTWWVLHFATDWQWNWALLGHGASLKDIFLNPNQVTAAKGGNFEHYGSYIGVIGLILSFLGIAATLRQKRYLPYLALTLLSPFLAILFPDAIIATTFGLAFFAAQGLTGLRTFLGSDRLAAALTYIIAILVLLDLYNIGTRVLEYGRY